MREQIPPGRAFSCTAPTLAPNLAALRRNLQPLQVEASSGTSPLKPKPGLNGPLVRPVPSEDRLLSTLLRGFVICLSRAEPRAPQIHGRRLQPIENLARLLVADVARQQPCHDLHQSALHGRRILQRRGFKPSLPRALCVFSRAPRLLTVMGIAVPRPSHGGGRAAGGVVHPVLA
jgi:hypothetical protein